jgi:PPM family protein phosphatase
LAFPSKLAEIEFAGLSETGPIRDNNQDAILLPDGPLPGTFTSLAGLADGMGGYASGDVASRLALTILRQVALDMRGSMPEKVLRRGVETANLEVYKTARELDAGRMGTTLTAAYIAGDQLFLAHVGDSRAYLLRNGNIRCLTNDHSVVGDLVRSKLIPPEAVRTHEKRSILTRSVGLELFVSPEITSHKLAVGDRLILCSDGLWSAVEDEKMASVASRIKAPEALGRELIEQAIANASDDNCSIVVADIHAFLPLAVPAAEPARHKWFGFFGSR